MRPPQEARSTSAIIRPPRLKPGDTLGIAAPSGPFDIGLFERGMEVLKEMGFALKIPAGIFKRNGFLAGTDPERADIINQLIRDPAVKGIVCARGGYGATRLEPYLDWEAIRTHPKVFIGFSDITVLHHLIVSRCGLVTFHGPMGTTLGTASPESRQALVQALTSATPIVVPAPKPTVIQPGEARGPVAGGNLAMICHLLGTPLQPDFEGRLMVLEEVNEAPYRIDRMLWQMKLAGCFQGLAGVCFGDFVDCGDLPTIEAILTDLFQDSPYPVLAGLPVGHGRGNHTLPLGLEAVLTTDPPQLRFTSPATV